MSAESSPQHVISHPREPCKPHLDVFDDMEPALQPCKALLDILDGHPAALCCRDVVEEGLADVLLKELLGMISGVREGGNEGTTK